MPWAKLDENFPDHPKVEVLTDSAFRLHVTAICYSARVLTDGRLSPHAVRKLDARKRDIAALVNAGLWEVEDPDYVIHDYLEYNPSRAEVEAERERKQRAGRAGAAARYGKRAEAEAPVAGAIAPAIAPATGMRGSPSRPDPYRETIVSLSGESEPVFVRELRDEWLGQLPAKYQRDATTFDDMALLAHDYAMEPDVVREVIRAIKRDGDIAFPGSIRKRLKESTPKPRNSRAGPPPSEETLRKLAAVKEGRHASA